MVVGLYDYVGLLYFISDISKKAMKLEAEYCFICIFACFDYGGDLVS